MRLLFRKCRRIDSSGQTAIEFVILVGVLLFIFVLFLIAINQQIADKNREKINSEIDDLAYSIRSEINLAYESIDGYHRDFEVPEKLSGRSINATVIDNSIYIRTVDGVYSASYSVSPVVGNLSIGTNTLRKDDGVVYLNQ